VHDVLGLDVSVALAAVCAFGWWLVRLRGALRDGSGAFQMQACDHEGVPSGERGPQGNAALNNFSGICLLIFLQGGDCKENNDYVTRIEFRLLLVIFILFPFTLLG
jgi:hypothetical protein